ncbi:hypothetical protein IFM89_007866 [Coptis chinensis]|uniref:RNA exonuclease 4 n=1 Tax=Coptis chinensis TaxID=261450 RepID=A0A835GYE0_9MAGN|nr:hypothetical protein IFM89_007866 [Coptis chinensis]
MKSEATNPPSSKNQLTINPNWAQLQQGKGKREKMEKDDDDSISVLTPTNTDCSLTDTIAMDCEMVGVSSQGNKSALARVTLVNAWGNIVYDEFVRPMERVVDFRTTISGIRPRDMRKAKDFGDVQTKVAELVKGRILVGHALHNDFKALLLSHPRNHIRDTSEYQPFLKEGRRRALKSLALEFLNAKIQDGAHCPVDDARAAMLLYQKHKKAWERSLKVHLKFKNKHKNRKPKRKNTEG